MRYLQTLIAAALLWGSGQSLAVELFILPPDTTVEQGDTVEVELWIDGLDGSNPNENLAGFDFNVLFNDAVLDLVSVEFGTEVGGLPATQDFSLLAAGVLNITELSLLPDLSTQLDEFLLATVTFSGAAIGISGLSFADVFLSDAAASLIHGFVLTGGTIGVIQGVPAPAPAALLGLGMVALFWARRRDPES